MEEKSITNIDEDNFNESMHDSRFDQLEDSLDQFDLLRQKVAKDILEASANNKKISWEDIFNIKQKSPLFLNNCTCTNNFFKLVSDNINQVLLSDDFIEKMLNARVRNTHFSTVSFVGAILLQLRYRDDYYQIRHSDNAQSFVKNLLNVLKSENKFLQIERFVSQLAKAIKEDMIEKIRAIIKKKECGADDQVELYQKRCKQDKEVVIFIQKSLIDIGMHEQEKLFMNDLNETLVKTNDVLSKVANQDIMLETHVDNNSLATDIKNDYLEVTQSKKANEALVLPQVVNQDVMLETHVDNNLLDNSLLSDYMKNNHFEMTGIDILNPVKQAYIKKRLITYWSFHKNAGAEYRNLFEAAREGGYFGDYVKNNNLRMEDVWTLLSQANDNNYFFASGKLVKLQDFSNAARASGHFCYYVCMLPITDYESWKNNFSGFERFKVMLYRSLLWRFFKPEISVNPIVAHNNRQSNISVRINQAIEQNHPKSERTNGVENSENKDEMENGE